MEKTKYPFDEEWIRNRDKPKVPDHGRYWCDCDRDIVGIGERCKVCGKKNESRKNRKSI